YRGLLSQESRAQFTPENRDFDTGRPTRPCEYKLADETYAQLAVRLADRDPDSVAPALRRDILTFFSDLNLPYAVKQNSKKWADTVAALEKLKAGLHAASK
ncbi:MAG TPA: hypothetical protein VGS58_22600, partial [Candidatus Sulfopaludibacter sp.]|nr:hypothetical protein [Candidatus Sulfopaludibacter sp.]